MAVTFVDVGASGEFGTGPHTQAAADFTGELARDVFLGFLGHYNHFQAPEHEDFANVLPEVGSSTNGFAQVRCTPQHTRLIDNTDSDVDTFSFNADDAGSEYTIWGSALFRGVHHVGDHQTNTTTSGSFDVPAYTVETDGSMAVLCLLGGYDGSPPASFTGWTMQQGIDSNYMRIYTKAVDAGSQAAEQVPSWSDTEEKVAYVVVLEASAEGTTPAWSDDFTTGTAGNTPANWTKAATGAAGFEYIDDDTLGIGAAGDNNFFYYAWQRDTIEVTDQYASRVVSTRYAYLDTGDARMAIGLGGDEADMTNYSIEQERIFFGVSEDGTIGGDRRVSDGVGGWGGGADGQPSPSTIGSQGTDTIHRFDFVIYPGGLWECWVDATPADVGTTVADVAGEYVNWNPTSTQAGSDADVSGPNAGIIGTHNEDLWIETFYFGDFKDGVPDDPGGGSPQTWTASTTAVAEAAATSGIFVGDQTWAGGTGTAELAATSGAFVPGVIVWAGSAATVAAEATSGTFTPGVVVWAGSTATVELIGTSGSFVGSGGPQTWTGGVATFHVIAYTASLIPLDLRLVSKDVNSITMEWDGVWGATGYDIRRDGVVVESNWTGGNQYTDGTLNAETEYDHEVRAVFT